MKGIISVDLEDWYTSAYLKDYVKGCDVLHPKIVESTGLILELFNRKKIKATFFVLGSVAERAPELIRRISDLGHEIASHGYSHTPLWALNRETFRDELRRTDFIINGILGIKPLGFRAPYASIDQRTSWAIDILAEEGFEYDSSVFPMRTPLYGVEKAPNEPYRISSGDILREDPEARIIEFPFSVLKAGWFNIPCTGGFYGRVLPYFFLNLLLKVLSKKRPINFYFHPWEIYPGIPRVKTPLVNRFVSYFNVKGYLKKIERLLGSFDFVTFKEYIKTELQPT